MNSSLPNDNFNLTVCKSLDIMEQRPQKKLRPEPTATIDTVLLLTEIGITNYHLGHHNKAEQFFSQALCRVDRTFIIDPVTSTNIESSASLKVSKRRALGQLKLVDDRSSVPPSRKIDTKDKTSRTEYDEGMRVYESPMALNDISNPDLIASTLYYNIGQTYTRQKFYADAITWFHRSLTLCNHANESNGHRTSLLVIKTLHCLGYCSHRLGNDDKASTYYERALSLLSESKLGSSVHLAASLNCVGVLHFNSQTSNNTDIAMEMFRESLNIYRSLTNTNRSNKIAVATVLNNIGRVYYLQSKFQESLDVYEESLRIRREILGSNSVDVAATVYNIGQTCHQVGQLDESLAYYKEFLRIATSGVMSMDSASKDMALVFKGIAEIYQEKSDLKMALFYFSRALELQKNSDNIYNTDVATTLNKLGNICYEMKKFTSAMSHYKKGLDIERKVLPANHPHTIITLVNIAHIHKQLGEHEKALTAYMAACKMQMTAFGRSSLSVAETLSSIGLMQYHIRDYESSFESYQEALRIRRHSYGTDEHLDVASTLNSIGLVLFKQDFFDLAKKCFGESLRIRSKILGRDHRDVAILWYNIATIHFETGEDDTAVGMYKETLRVERKALGEDHPDVVLTLQHLGQVHQQMGQIDDALRYFNEALNIEVKNSKNRTDPNKSGSMARLLNLLGNVYLQMGKAEDMMKCYSEASRIYEASQQPGETLVIAGYNFYGLSKTNPPCAAVA